MIDRNHAEDRGLKWSLYSGSNALQAASRLRSPPAVSDWSCQCRELQSGLVLSGKSSALPLRLATQMRNSGDGNQDSTPDRQGEELAEIEKVERRRDHLQDDQREQ